MSRYIDADKLVELLDKKQKIDYEMGLYNHGALTEAFIRFVERQPTADVVEVRHGEWIIPKRRDADDWKECSRCEYYFDVSVGHKPTPYCPECGAKMDAERSENGR